MFAHKPHPTNQEHAKVLSNKSYCGSNLHPFNLKLQTIFPKKVVWRFAGVGEGGRGDQFPWKFWPTGSIKIKDPILVT